MDLQLALVAGSAVAYLTSVFTRDAFLAFGAFLAFYLFIFAPTYFAPSIVDTSDAFDVFFYVPASAAIYAALGFATSKLFDVGQLVDVWQTGSGGGPRSREELNLPLMAVGLVMLFFAVFFAVAAESTTGFLGGGGGVLALSDWQAGLLAGMFGLLALAAVISSGVQVKRGARFKGIHDWASVIYFFVWALTLTVALLAWYDPFDWYSIEVAGGLAGGIGGGIVLVTGLVVGIVYEMRRDRFEDNYKDAATGATVYTRQGRMYAQGEWWGYLCARGFFIVALFVVTFVVAGFAVDATAGDGDDAVRNLFWYPWMVFWPVVTTLVFAMLYVCLYVAVKLPMADYPAANDDGSEGKAMLGGGDDDDTAAKKDPESDMPSEEGFFGSTEAKVSTSRRRTALRSSRAPTTGVITRSSSAAATKKTLDLSNMRF